MITSKIMRILLKQTYRKYQTFRTDILERTLAIFRASFEVSNSKIKVLKAIENP